MIYRKDLYDWFAKRGYGEDNNYVQSGVLPAEDGEEGSGCLELGALKALYMAAVYESA